MRSMDGWDDKETKIDVKQEICRWKELKMKRHTPNYKHNSNNNYVLLLFQKESKKKKM